MKKILSLVLTLTLAIALTACGNAGSAGQAEPSAAPESAPPTAEESEHTENNDIAQAPAESETEQQTEPAADTPEETGSRVLVAYFSRTGENYSVGYIEKGNTHIIADVIAEQIGGDTFEIRTVTPYPDDYDECTNIAQQERNENARPELAESLDNLDDYDVIFIGFPIWWSDMPMAVYTFLESYDFAGKTIVPFCTHEGTVSEEEPAEDDSATVTTITMTAGDTVITAELSDSETTRAFLETLPRTFTMNRYGDREYYGRMESISENGEVGLKQC